MHPFKKNSFLILVFFTVTTCFCSFFKPENIFGNSTLHFVFTSDLTFAEVGPDFEIIRHNNNYSPLVTSASLGNNVYNFTPHFSYVRNTQKSSRSVVTFLNLNLYSIHYIASHNYWLLKQTVEKESPAYIFAHVEHYPDWDSDYVKSFTGMTGNSKFFLHQSDKNLVWTVCIPCSSVVQVSPDLTTFYELGRIWDIINLQNMQKKIVRTMASWFDLEKNLDFTCGPNLFYRGVTESPYYCGISELGRKYNFTPMTSADERIQPKRVIGLVIFRYMLRAGDIDDLLIIVSPLMLTMDKFEFTIVTNFPTTVGSLETLFSPFDYFTWTFLLLSCIAIIVLIYSERKLLSLSTLKFEPIFNLVSQLIGQGSFYFGNLNFKTIAVFWSFFCYILMENLYQGSIYSCLTVTLPPSVPKTIEDVISSNLQVITTSSILSVLVIQQNLSVLQHKILPDLIPWFPADSAYSRTIQKFNSSLYFLNLRDITRADIAATISNSQDILASNKTIRTSGTFAVMDDKNDLNNFSSLMKILGKRLLIKGHSGHMDFYTFYVDVVKTNFIVPKLYEGINRLVESGIYGRWGAMNDLKADLEEMRKVGSEPYRKLFRMEMVGTGRDDFKEDWTADPVPFEAIKYMFGLCLIILSLTCCVSLLEHTLGIISVCFTMSKYLFT